MCYNSINYYKGGMRMERTVKKLLAAEGITLVAPLSLSACRITKPYLLAREGIEDGSVFVFAVPYYTTECAQSARNISAYAVSRDYHLYFGELFARVLPALREAFPENRFAGFTDHSPIAEGEAAVRAGLGYYGKNHLFLTDAYSSYVFLGEIITDAILNAPAREARACMECGACLAACPVTGDVSRCLSALTQKKGDFTDEERARLLAHGCAWGCDICQEACPVTRRAKASGSIYTAIPFFTEQTTPHLTTETVQNMSEDDFAARAYSWRGKATLLRNLAILEKGEPT